METETIGMGVGSAADAGVEVVELSAAEVAVLSDPASEAAKEAAARYAALMVSEADARVAGAQSRVDKIREHLAGAEASLAAATTERAALGGGEAEAV